MMTEDELRERLNREVAGIRPRGDLLESLAHRHARRHRYAAVRLIGSSLAASAAAVAIVVGVFASFAGGPTLQVDPAGQTDAQIIAAARRADESAHNMIINVVFEQGGKKKEGWALRSEKRARVTESGVSDTTFSAAGVQEEVNYQTKTVTTYRNQPAYDVVVFATPTGLGDPHGWLHDPSIAVHRGKDGTVYLSANWHGAPLTVWLDSRTGLPKEVEYGTQVIQLRWLPATDTNRELLTHTVPPNFTPSVYSSSTRSNKIVPPSGPTN